MGAGHYSAMPVRRREDCLLLYCPPPSSPSSSTVEAAVSFSKAGVEGSRRSSATLETGPPYEVSWCSEDM